MTTTNKSLAEPIANSLTWNTPLNANFSAIDKAFGSFVSIATTSGNYALLTADLQNMCLKSNTSAFTGNVTYTIPNGIAGQWVVINQSAASAFTLSVVCGASSVLVARGDVRSIYCDGISVFYADTPATAGSDTQIIFNSSGIVTGSSNLTFNGAAVSVGGSTATTNAACATTTATVTFNNGQTIPVGSVVTITGVTPTGYNGTWVTTGTATLNQVQFTVPVALANQSVAGTLSFGNLNLGGNLIGGIASQALAAAGTNNNAVMTPLSTAQAITGQVGVANAAPVKTAVNASGSAPIYACRAWVNFNGSTGAINASGNVSSVTKVSTGTFTINFTIAMPNVNYVITGNAIDSNGSNDTTVGVTSLTTTTASITVAHGVTKYTAATVFVQVVC
jgi:hypothetical protein